LTPEQKTRLLRSVDEARDAVMALVPQARTVKDEPGFGGLLSEYLMMVDMFDKQIERIQGYRPLDKEPEY
jgi:hypothetical protein